MEGAIQPNIINDPRLILWSLVSGGFGLLLIILEIAKWIGRNSGARKAAGILFGLDQKQDNGDMDLRAALIDFVKGFQKTEEQNRVERSDQWKQIEAFGNSLREQSLALKEQVVASKEVAHAMREVVDEIKRLDKNQERLNDMFWQELRERKAG